MTWAEDERPTPNKGLVFYSLAPTPRTATAGKISPVPVTQPRSVSQQFVNGTSAQYQIYNSAIQIQESRAIEGEPRDAAVKFGWYRILQ